MNTRKKFLSGFKAILIVIIVAFICPITVFANPALEDGYNSTLINPAAPAFRRADGFAYEMGISTDSKFSSVEPTSHKFFANVRGLSYVGDFSTWDIEHTIGLSAQVFKNIYFGSNWTWVHDKSDSLVYNFGILARPWDALSVGLTGIDPFTDNRDFVIGLGLRPLFALEDHGHKVTIGADVNSSDWTKPRISLNTVPIDGLHLDVSYDFKTELFTTGLSFSFSHLNSGATYNGDYTGTYHFHASPFEFPSTGYNEWPIYREMPNQFLAEEPEMDFIFFDNQEVSLQSAITYIKEMKDDPRIQGILFKNSGYFTSYAGYLELKEALISFRNSGKQVVWYFETASMFNYALAASVADKIYLNPRGIVDIRGFSSTRLYFKDLFDEYGIKFINVRSHDYKTAGNMFSESGMTEAEREALQFVLDDEFEVYKRLIKEGRGDLLKSPIETIVDRGPYLIAQDALADGLVDQLIYEDELYDMLENQIPGFQAWKDGLPPLIRQDWADDYGKRIAVIYANGLIVSGTGAPGSVIGSESLARAIRRARKDPMVAGIIMRVDSGGGSALASDVIAREVWLTTNSDEKKPFIVSMGGVAASGGYYISAYADKIIASPVTLTGSIGVVAGIPNASGFIEKFKVHSETLTTSDSGDFLNLFEEPDQADIAMLERTIDDTYERFVDVVAEGRGLSTERVDEIAQGRIWTGRQALELGLVDQLGTFDDAVLVMKEMLGADSEPELHDYSYRGEFWQRISSRYTSEIMTDVLGKEITNFFDTAGQLAKLKSEKTLYLLPFEITAE